MQLEDHDVSEVIRMKSELSDKPSNEILRESSAEVRALCCQWKTLGVKYGMLYRAYSPVAK